MSIAGAASAVFRGTVLHQRRGAPSHGFEYPIFMWLLDLDELATLSRVVRGFSYNRRGLIAFDDADHFDGSRGRLLAQVRRRVEESGVSWPGGPVRVLTNCRMLGHVFNPVSFWYCHAPDGRVATIVAEVNNTFGERHCYVSSPSDALEPSGSTSWLRWRDKKVFHVSPFFSLDGTYQFTIEPPADRMRVRIDLLVDGETRIVTGLDLTREPLTAASAWRLSVAYPLLTARIVGRIHWQALRLWRKGAAFHAKPPYDPSRALDTRT